MALTKREINNIGSPLYAPDGSILAGKLVEFLLVDADGNACDAWDVASGERILPIKETAVISNGLGALPAGEFTISLWPNDRGSEATVYRCSIKGHPEATFTAALESGAAPIKWIDFMAQGQPLSPTQLSAIQQYVDVSISNVQTQLDAKAPKINPVLSGTALVNLSENDDYFRVQHPDETNVVYFQVYHNSSGPRGVVMGALPTHANDAAAVAAGLTNGYVYKTATGELRAVVGL